MAENSDVYAWGWNKFGQVGAGNSGPREEMVVCPQRLRELDFLDENDDSIARMIAGRRMSERK